MDNRSNRDLADRVSCLQGYAILDTAPEVIYDEMTKMAAQICECPVATIGLIDDRRQWAKSRYGLPPDEKPKELSICNTTISQSDLLAIPDLTADDRFCNLPNVTGRPHFKFYCGTPLINREGYALGTICVMDFEPRQLSFEQQEALRCLSHQVMAQLELRRSLIELDTVHRELAVANQQIELEKQQVDRILYNVMPPSVANELKLNGSVKPRYVNCASIVFADFAGFTKLADGMEPVQLIEQLDTFFSAFDKITNEFGLTRLKTIGDAYMAVSGAPEFSSSHAADACHAALRLRDYMARQNDKRSAMRLEPWEVRIGVHSGPIIAGVVGSQSYSFDVWGDTVNVAARIEDGGALGEVTVSEYTANLVESEFEIVPAGEFQAKNKGLLKVYRLVGKKPDNS